MLDTLYRLDDAGNNAMTADIVRLARGDKPDLLRDLAGKAQLHFSELARGSPACVRPPPAFRLLPDAQIPSWIPTSPMIFRLPYPPP